MSQESPFVRRKNARQKIRRASRPIAARSFARIRTARAGATNPRRSTMPMLGVGPGRRNTLGACANLAALGSGSHHRGGFRAGATSECSFSNGGARSRERAGTVWGMDRMSACTVCPSPQWRRLLRLGRSTPALVNVVQHNPCQQIGRVIQVGPFDGEGPQLLGQAIPAIEGAVVYVNDL